jgi:hypothetical protein
MPEPVFRRSSGFTPQFTIGNEDPTITPDSIPTLEIDTSDESKGELDATAETTAIAEQPDTTADEPAAMAVDAAPPAKKRGGFLRLLFMILGIAVIALVIGAVITAAVLWYFFQVSESQNLN